MSPVTQVEDIGGREEFTAPLDRYYKGRPFHRVRDSGSFNLEKMVAELKAQLVRSAQEFMPSPSGTGRQLNWTNALFDLGDGVFYQFTIGSGAAVSGSYGFFTMIVTASDPAVAAQHANRLVDEFGPSSRKHTKPGFFLIKSIKGEPSRVDVDRKYELSNPELRLHYGEEFLEWSESFQESLSEPGVSILRGEPGTGKTSFLRHVISKLHETHRFYYLPVESFNLVRANEFPSFWSRQHRGFPNAVHVLVLEDAESILQQRTSGGTQVSGLLNMTDGLVSEIAKVHMICTLNAGYDDIDAAILRPGRQRSSHEFSKLSFEQASALAASLGVTLTERKEYTLAELYHVQDVKRTRTKKEPRPIGFGK